MASMLTILTFGQKKTLNKVRASVMSLHAEEYMTWLASWVPLKDASSRLCRIWDAIPHRPLPGQPARRQLWPGRCRLPASLGSPCKSRLIRLGEACKEFCRLLRLKRHARRISGSSDLGGMQGVIGCIQLWRSSAGCSEGEAHVERVVMSPMSTLSSYSASLTACTPKMPSLITRDIGSSL